MQTKTPRGAHVEIDDPVLQRLESWRRRQERIPSRSEAVRFLLALALDSMKSEPAAA